MENLKNSLKGKKTYFLAGIAAAIWFASATGLIDPALTSSAYQILAILATGTMAAKINRLSK